MDDLLMNQKLKVGIVAGYMDFFDAVMPAGYRNERFNWAKYLTSLLGDEFEVVFPGMIVNREDGVMAGKCFQEEQVDIILAIPTMAAPPGFSWEAVKHLESIPLLVWDCHEMTSIPADYTMKDLIRHSSNVGTIMFTNLALRNGRKPQLVVGAYHDEEIVRKVIQLARIGGIIGRLRKMNVGVIGSPIDGYDQVTAEEQDVKTKLGPQLKHIDVQEFTDTFQSISLSEVTNKIVAFKQQCIIEEIPEDELGKSVKLALTLERISNKHKLSGGAFNCRGEYGRKNPLIGVVGCLGVSYMTTIGRPYTCTGDLVTALAMILSKQLGAPVLYCECDQIDYEKDFMLMANTGESDFCFSCDKPCIIATKDHSGQPSQGASMFTRAPKGPATLVGLSPKAEAKNGWVLIIAPGSLLGTEHEELKVGNALFRFRNGPTPDAFRRWCLAGATHHGVLCAGDLLDELTLMGEWMDIETIIV